MFSDINLPEAEFLLWLQENVRTPFLTYLMNIVTFLGEKGIPCFLCALIMIILPKFRRNGCRAALSLGMDVLLTNVLLKNLFSRPRPFWEEVLGEKLTVPVLFSFMIPDEYSFPSGHTAIVFAFVFSLYGHIKARYAVLLTAVAATVAFSRLYLGVHYPTDVLGGILCGALSAVLANLIFRIFGRRFEKQSNTDS